LQRGGRSCGAREPVPAACRLVSGRGPGAPAQMVTFEAFRDLVKLLQLGVGDEAGIALAEEENVEARAAAQSAAAAEAASGAPVGPPMPFSAPSGADPKQQQEAHISNPTAACRLALQHCGRSVRAAFQPGGLLAARPCVRAAASVLDGPLAVHLLCTCTAGARAAGTGPFGAVGFSYGGGGGGGGGGASDSGASDASASDDSGSESDGGAGGGAGDDADGLAANLGIDDFSALLRRAEREEAATALGQKPRKKCASAAPPPCLPCRLPGRPARRRGRAPPAPRRAPAGARGRRGQAGCRAAGCSVRHRHTVERGQGPGRPVAALLRRGRRGSRVSMSGLAASRVMPEEARAAVARDEAQSSGANIRGDSRQGGPLV